MLFSFFASRDNIPGYGGYQPRLPHANKESSSKEYQATSRIYYRYFFDIQIFVWFKNLFLKKHLNVIINYIFVSLLLLYLEIFKLQRCLTFFLPIDEK